MSTKIEPPYNKIFASVLGELSEILQRKGDPFKSRAYKKAEETIYTYEGEITNVEQVKGKPGIGVAVLKKLNELVETGKIEFLEKERKDPINLFTKIHGIGPKKAEKLIEKKILSIEDLRNNLNELNNVQQKGLKYYEDLQKRIPREEIIEFEKYFDQFFQQINDGNSKFEIVGSYRRKSSSSGDIDVIVTNKNNDITIFNKFIDLLIEKKVLIEILSKGKTKSMAIGILSGEGKVARRIDFLYSPINEYAFAVLYFTGSKAFNTTMRGHALKMNLSLNEHGLYKMENKNKGNKLEKIFETENDIFEHLKLEYVEPENRKDYTSIKHMKEKTPEVKLIKELNKEKENEILKNPNVERINKEGSPTFKIKIKKSKKKKIEKENTPKKQSKKMKKEEKPKEEKPKEEKPKEEKPKKEKKPKEEKPKKVKSLTTKKLIELFKTEGIKVIESASEDDLVKLIKHTNKMYYNETPAMSDNEYDIVKEYFERKYPTNKVLDEIGAPIKSKEKVNLPYFMGSMDKIKPTTDALQKWLEKYKGEYVISAKLDGVSGLYTTDNLEQKLYTRGNGKVGQDISHFIPHLRLPNIPDVVIRGEFIIEKETFNTYYKNDFSNSRNFVSGIINSKRINKNKMKHIDFVAYEVIKPELKPYEQMKFLETNGFNCVINKKLDEISNDILSQQLVSLRDSYKYEIDGIIICHNEIHERKDKNPEHAFAFKMVLTEQVAEAKILDVLWSPSKDGYLKPKIQIEPIQLGGVKIEYATAFNAAFVEEKKLGIGAIVKIIRSGDVIPYIMDVIQPAEHVKFPNEKYYWNDTHVDIILEDSKSNETVLLKNITMFFTTLNVKQLSEGNVKRIIDSGYTNVPSILKMSIADLLKVEGFKQKTAENIYNSIQDKLETSSLSEFMTASNIFGHGFGKKKFDLILKSYPNILVENTEKSILEERLSSVKGMAMKTAKEFISKKEEFVLFMKECNLNDKLKPSMEKVTHEEIQSDHVLFEKNIIFTGFKDKEMMKKLEDKYNVKISNTVNSKTFAVVVKDLSEDNNKTKKAVEMKIPIFTKDDFISKFKI